MARRTKSSLTSASPWRMCSTLGWPCTVPSKPSDTYKKARMIEWEFDYMFFVQVYMIIVLHKIQDNKVYPRYIWFDHHFTQDPFKIVSGRMVWSARRMQSLGGLRYHLHRCCDSYGSGSDYRFCCFLGEFYQLRKSLVWSLNSKFIRCIPTQTSWGSFVAARGIKLLCETGWPKCIPSNYCHQHQLTI